jgi:integrase
MPKFIDGHDVAAITRKTYQQGGKHIIRHLGGVLLTELTPAMVRTFKRALADGPLAASTSRKILSVLRQMCRTAVTDGYMPVDPTATVKGGKGDSYAEMRILADDEYAAIIDAITPHYRLLVRVLWATGMRWSEAIAIRPDAVYSRGGKFFVKVRRTLVEFSGEITEQNHGKTPSATREISIPASLARDLLAAPVVNGWIFRALRGGSIFRSHFRRIWRKAQAKAGITELARVHDIRHTAISRWANAGISLVDVRDRAGHTDISTTSRYLHRIDKGEDPFLALAA